MFGIKIKKTYLVAAVGIGLAIAQAFGVVIPPEVYAVLGSLGLATIRHGVATEAAK
jgi:hypothetical protein